MFYRITSAVFFTNDTSFNQPLPDSYDPAYNPSGLSGLNPLAFRISWILNEEVSFME